MIATDVAPEVDQAKVVAHWSAEQAPPGWDATAAVNPWMLGAATGLGVVVEVVAGLGVDVTGRGAAVTGVGPAAGFGVGADELPVLDGLAAGVVVGVAASFAGFDVLGFAIGARTLGASMISDSTQACVASPLGPAKKRAGALPVPRFRPSPEPERDGRRA